MKASELLLFLEEHAEADDSAIYQQATHDGHDHRRRRDNGTVCE
jgi:hypothetical protein